MKDRKEKVFYTFNTGLIVYREVVMRIGAIYPVCETEPMATKIDSMRFYFRIVSDSSRNLFVVSAHDEEKLKKERHSFWQWVNYWKEEKNNE